MLRPSVNDGFAFFFVFSAEEMKGHRENLERERRLNEALTAKLTDLEANAVKRETEMADLKRFLQTVKEEHQQLILVSQSARRVIRAAAGNEKRGIGK
jgi:beta-phosphoglucomutase-like phosphatase (HAD superfamily)